MNLTIQGRTSLASAALVLSGLMTVGCARGGGGDPDAGVIVPRDTGTTPGVDSGPTPTFDSGPTPGVDSGPSPTFDAGPTPTVDSGSGGTCPESPCRLLPPQCGCPAGQGCYLGSGSTRICGTSGPEVEGQACSGATACQAGMLCIGSTSSPSYCSRFCGSDADCTGGAGSLCLLTLNDGSGGTIPGVQLCTIHCNPAAASTSACPSGLGCALYGEEMGLMRFFTGCRPVGSGIAGSPCTTTDDCATGHFCADPTGSGFNECIRYCTYPSGFECSGLETCNRFSDMPAVGGVEYGFCY